jgi:hypothetical protein
MFDEVQHLRDSPTLQRLLEHYARSGAADREAWQDRLMELDGTGPHDLVQLHGELLAFNWIEQNTGVTPNPRRGAVPGCYRVTLLGQRALRRAADSEDEAAEAA